MVADVTLYLGDRCTWLYVQSPSRDMFPMALSQYILNICVYDTLTQE